MFRQTKISTYSKMVGALSCAGLCVLLSAAVAAQTAMVKVTVARANVRAEASEKAPVLLQAKLNDQIELKDTLGDWFKVLLPPNPSLGGARVEAYISKKVARAITVAGAPAAPAGTPTAPPAPAPPTVDEHGITVVLGNGADGSLLTSVEPTQTPDKDRMVWTVTADTAAVIPAGRSPITLSIGDRAGVDARDVAPLLVTLTPGSPSASGAAQWIVGSLKGERDWKSSNASIDIREIKEAGPGIRTITPSRDLKPGNYALVLKSTKSGVPMPPRVWVFILKPA